MPPIPFLFVFPRVLMRNFIGFQHHLGTAYLSAYLGRHGIRTEQFIHPGNLPLRQTAEAILDRNPRVVGFTAYYTNYALLRLLAAELRRMSSDVRIVVGGPSATFAAESILEDCTAIDLSVRSFAEETARELAEWAEGRRPLDSIAGITCRAPGGTRSTPDRPMLSSSADALDAFPDPYLEGLIPPEFAAEIGIVTSRGCRFRCAFCSVLTRGAVAWHSVDRVISVLRHFERAFSSSKERVSIPIQDDNFAGDARRLEQMLERMAEERFQHIEFTALMRTESLREATFPLLRRAGVSVISFGLESAVPEVLAAMKKVRRNGAFEDGFRKERAYLGRIEWAVDAAKRAGLTVQCSMMLGYPGETEAQGRATLEFIRRVGFDRYDHNFFEAVPGSEAHAFGERFGIRVAPDVGGWVPEHTPKFYDVTRVPFGENCENRSILASYYMIRALRLLSGNLEIGAGQTPGGIAPLLGLTEESLSPALLERWNRESPLFAGVFVMHHGEGLREDFQAHLNTHGSVFGANTLRLANGEGAPKRWIVNQAGLAAPPENESAIYPLRCSELNWPHVPDCVQKRWSALLLSVENQQDAEALAMFGRPGDAANAIYLPAAIPGALTCVADACRWGSARCPAARGERWFADAGGCLRLCFSGVPIGQIGDSLHSLRKSLDARTVAEESRRGCRACGAADFCSRCLFTGPLSVESFCHLRRSHPNLPLLVDGLTLLRELRLAETIELRSPAYTIRSLRHVGGGELDCAGSAVSLASCLLLTGSGDEASFLYSPGNSLLVRLNPDQAEIISALASGAASRS